MAIFDVEARRIVVRVVYDGPGLAGKTTNLQQLCKFFTTFRRSALYSPDATGSRTRYLDWLQIDSGLVSGHPLRSHFITVPGQTVLARRRFHLLGVADVVVFVTESSERGLREAEPMFEVLRLFLEQHKLNVPIVVQANKQDMVGASDLGTVARRLGVDSDVPVVAAQAESGAGVRETAVLAIRAAADRVQAMLRQRGLEAMSGVAETGEQLRARIAELELQQPMSPVDVVLSRGLQPDSAATPTATADPSEATPPMPSPDVASGFVWPSTTGRDVLRRVPVKDAVLRGDLRGQLGAGDGSGRSDTLIYEAGIWCLKTSLRRRFADLDEAKNALVQLARRKIQLGSLLPHNTALALERDATGTHWLWTVTPWLATLRHLMLHAAEHTDEARLGEALSTFAQLAVSSAALAARQGIVLDIHPSNFASLGDRLYYLDDDIIVGDGLPAFGHAVLRRVDEYASYPEAIARYLETLTAELTVRLTPEEVSVLDLCAGIEGTIVRSSAAQTAKAHLLSALDRSHPRLN